LRKCLTQLPAVHNVDNLPASYIIAKINSCLATRWIMQKLAVDGAAFIIIYMTILRI
jgi:hypothetical protein